jgi:2-oxoglutarate ferredoxin oxidoreductase subunit alpha
MLEETAFLKNSEIFAEAMIRNGIRYHFAYPITPASDVMKYTADHFHTVKGRMFQPESEISVINAVAGCSCAGELAVASTSGPGIDLMQETISFMAAGELPCILLDNMRVGPGDGDIVGSQGDYFQATRGGGHGDYRIIVIAPASGQEIVKLMPEAVDLTFRYRTPVLFLIDGVLAQITESVRLPKFQNTVGKYKTDHWAITGAKKREKRFLLTGCYNHVQGEEMNQRLGRKYQEIKDNEQRWEEKGLQDAEVVIVAFGLPGRMAGEIVQEGRQNGKKLGLIRPITLWPFPEKAFYNLSGDLKALLVVEMNQGQMIDDVKIAAGCKAPVEFLGKVGGDLPAPKAIDIQLCVDELFKR